VLEDAPSCSISFSEAERTPTFGARGIAALRLTTLSSSQVGHQVPLGYTGPHRPC
ncbi:hypothetical protein FOZ63_012797, partial [Perkinsus olseni]